MKNIAMSCLVSLLILLPVTLSSNEEPLNAIEVFHKNQPPSLQTLEKVNGLLDEYSGEYEMTFYNISDSVNIALIREYNLPDTHFPFAVVVNGNYSAEIDGRKVDFVHFPLFMHGIGRHEGNWSLNDLSAVLDDNSLLLEENILPVLEDDEDSEDECLE
ncbi:MAG: hypothetical protein K8R90_06815 [Candidatus Cloacimonetes bacterium]|nr:hypothetical protein [Candidatus Cloacimonadota bacterium]